MVLTTLHFTRPNTCSRTIPLTLHHGYYPTWLLLTIQWNLHKTDTIGEHPFGHYREVVFLGRFRLPAMYAL